MRLLILADIHANWYALESVLADVDGQYDEILCCGDLVGYNPHPDRIVDWVRSHCRVCIRGNHDKVVAGLERLDWFNNVARVAAQWTMQTMQTQNIEFLRELQKGPISTNDLEICHGSPLDEDEYVTNPLEAEHCFQAFCGTLLFFGHSHLQGAFAYRRSKVMAFSAVKKQRHDKIFQLEVDTQYMVNPGSIGQPRDGDPRAAYAIYETESKVISFHRVPYPISKTAMDIREAGLPDVLAMRLFHGL